jgi:Skp family chaperone for outer membrane proteins
VSFLNADGETEPCLGSNIILPFGEYAVKKITRGVTLMVLGLAAFAPAGLLGQAQAQATGTRVAIVNVGLVFSKYEKAKFYKSELETTLKPFKTEGEKIADQMKKYAAASKEKTVDPKLKDQYEQYLVKLKRDMEDLDMRARKLIGTKQEEQIIILYKEVIGAIQAFAKANNYQLVLGYGQQIEGDLYSFANINRIMQGMDMGGATPLFLESSVDISQSIVDTLNAYYRGGGGAVPAIPTSTHK